MTVATFPRPVEGDCSAYYFKYIDQIPDVDILTLLHTQRDWFGEWIEGLDDDQLKYAYAPGKWTLAEMIGHVFDTERVFAYRMMAISRNEKKSLPGFEQDDYVTESIYDTLSALELANEWRAIRSSTIYLARHMNAEMASRMGLANDTPVRVSAFPYVMAGHLMHHYKIAQEKYLING
jgi:hypothetical protein